MWEGRGVGEGRKSRRKREGGRVRGIRERKGVGGGRKSQRKRRERAQGIEVKITEKREREKAAGDRGVVGAGEGKNRQKVGNGRGGRCWQGRIIPKKMANTNP